jgi:transposase-like protein
MNIEKPDWPKILRDYEVSGDPASIVAERHGVTFNQLKHQWRKAGKSHAMWSTCNSETPEALEDYLSNLVNIPPANR